MCTVFKPHPCTWIFTPSNRHIRCLQWAIPSGMRTIFQSISTAWVVFPVLYKSVFFPDYLLLINLFFLRGRRLSCLFCTLLMTCVSVLFIYFFYLCKCVFLMTCVSVGGRWEVWRSKRGRVGCFIMKGSRRVTWLTARCSLQEDRMELQVIWFITATVFSSVHLTPLVSLEGKFTPSSTLLL